MKFCYAIHIILCTVVFESCTVIQKPDTTFLTILNDSNNVKNKKLQFEGAYHNNSENSHYLEFPVFFFRNGLVYYDNGSSITASGFEDWIHKYFAEKKSWGVYEIVGDTLKVHTYFPFYDNFSHYIQTNFQGIVKNQDTILQWHMVEPYPKLNKRLLEYYNFLFKERKDLYFKPLSINPFMDSVAHKAWVNKYRDSK